MAVDVWRLQTRTDNKEKGKIAQFCIDNKIVAMGWSLTQEHIKKLTPKRKEKVLERKKHIKTFEHYDAIVKQYNIYDSYDSVKRFCKQFKKDDLVWVRTDGIYWLGRYTDDSEYIFDNKVPEDMDAANQITNIDWHKIGDENEVPGAVCTALIRGSTFQRINKPGIAAVSQLIYNQKVNREHYKNVTFDNSMDNFFTLISPTGCEDLLCMYLYDQEGYICIPSTNKIATELYECVLINPKTGNIAYIQSKEYNNHDAVIDGNKYLHLLNGQGKEKVYFFLHKAKPLNIKNNPDMHIVDSQTLYNFALNPTSKNTLPKNILHWISFMRKNAK